MTKKTSTDPADSPGTNRALHPAPGRPGAVPEQGKAAPRSKELQEAIDFLKANLRIEMQTKKQGGGAYYDGPRCVELTVSLVMGDEELSKDEATVYLD